MRRHWHNSGGIAASVTASRTLLELRVRSNKKYMYGIWKKTLKRVIHDIKDFVKDEEVTKINKIVVWMRMTLRST